MRHHTVLTTIIVQVPRAQLQGLDRSTSPEQACSSSSVSKQLQARSSTVKREFDYIMASVVACVSVCVHASKRGNIKCMPTPV